MVTSPYLPSNLKGLGHVPFGVHLRHVRPRMTEQDLRGFQPEFASELGRSGMAKLVRMPVPRGVRGNIIGRQFLRRLSLRRPKTFARPGDRSTVCPTRVDLARLSLWRRRPVRPRAIAV